MSSLFTNSIIASLASNLLYFLTHLADLAVESDFLAEYRKILASFLPSVAMKRALLNILTFERSGRGLNWTNVGEIYYGYRVTNAYYMFFVTFLLTLMIGIYLTNVLRVSAADYDNAIKLPWYYPF